MKTYKIADFTVNMLCRGKLLKKAEKYLASPSDSPDFTLSFPQERIDKFLASHPDGNWESLVYVTLGKDFASQLLLRNSLVLHASAVEYNGNAYLFSADSGTGKSTHTSLWLKAFEGAVILNDDKPALRLENGKFYAYGTPWSGKTDLNVDHKVPLKAICFIERAKENSIERITSPIEILQLILSQTLRRAGSDKTGALLTLLDKLIATVPFYRLRCLPDENAARLAYKVMSESE
ncbi:MAG: hypothetical protein IKB86_03985 [Clostridia bacterium]|nr:hypothetical protein [Clostridia bacterium]